MRNLRCGLILLGLIVSFMAGVETATCQLEIGETAPSFSLQANDGKVYQVSQLAGYPVTILYFFSSSCGPCEQILRVAGDMLNEYRNLGLNVWAIASSPKADVEKLLRKLTLPFPVLIDQSHVADTYRANFVLPTTYLIDSEMKIIFTYEGGGRTAEVLIARTVQEKIALLQRVQDRFLQYKKIGIEAFNDKQYQLAYDNLSKALSIKPDRDCHLYLSYTLIVLNQQEKAETTISRGMKTYPDDPRFYQIYVRYLLARDETEKALQVLNVALKVNPEDVNLKYLKEYVEDMASGKRQKPNQ